jgi:Holliday junction DNA helicase RuvB
MTRSGDPAEETVQPAAGPDPALRPQSLAEFIGQEPVVQNLSVAIQAARLRDAPLDHVLLSGLPGLGKTTLAEIVSRELGVGFRGSSGPVLDRPADLAGLLTGLQRGDVLFIDEIHRLPTQVEEYLYGAMEDFKLVIMLDQGPRARSVPVSLEPFTLVGATTREGLLSGPFRARFGIHERVEPYDIDQLVLVARRSAGLLDVELSDDAARTVASGSRGTPRLVNHYLRRIRDLALVEGRSSIDAELAHRGLVRLGVDQRGLLPLDRRLLEVLHQAAPNPVGLKTLAVTLGEEDRTIEDVYEPFLIREGYVAKTARGRVLTRLGSEIVGAHAAGDGQAELFPS